MYRTLGSHTTNTTGGSDLIQIMWTMQEKIIGLTECLCKVLSVFNVCYLYLCRMDKMKSRFKKVQNKLLIFKDIMTHLSTRNPEIKNTVLWLNTNQSSLTDPSAAEVTGQLSESPDCNHIVSVEGYWDPSSCTQNGSCPLTVSEWDSSWSLPTECLQKGQ